MVRFLAEQGHRVNRKRVQRLMRLLGLVGMAPGPGTSKPHPEHKVYPYLLRGLVVRPNQVWSTDITYIRLAHGFAYLVAVMDWYSRRVLSWRLSKTLEAGSAWTAWRTPYAAWPARDLQHRPGSQFTSEAFTGVLLHAGITSAWTAGAGRWTTSSSSAYGGG